MIKQFCEQTSSSIALQKIQTENPELKSIFP